MTNNRVTISDLRSVNPAESSLSQRSPSVGEQHRHQQQETITISFHNVLSGDYKDEEVVQVNEDDSINIEDVDVTTDKDERHSLLPTFSQRRSTPILASSLSSRRDFLSSRRHPLHVDTPDRTDLPSSASSIRQGLFNGLLNAHWLGRDVDEDGPWTVPSTGTLLLDSSTIRLFKFFLVSIIALLVVHDFAWLFHHKHDATYGVRQMVQYDSSHIALDIVVFFVVGRLYQQPAVDRLVWMGPAIISAFLQSMVATHFASLQHSITPYEIHCAWSWQMWTLVFLGGVPLFGTIIGAHVVGSIRRGVAIPKLIELLATLVVFVTPYVGSPFFHLHHWYYGWLIGMHCNLDVWWSRLSMGVMWGVYLNGVAIFGRDPIMTCAVSLYQSQNQECPFLLGTDDGLQDVLHNYTLDDLARDSGTDWIERGCDTTPA